jgi:hypothetical protein
MKITDFGEENEGSDVNVEYPFMPGRCFSMLMAGPRGSGKTNTLCMMLTEPLINYDRLYVYAKNLQQAKLQKLQAYFEDMASHPNWIKKAGQTDKPAYFSSSSIMPLSSLTENLDKVVVFDDFLEAGKEEQRVISEYFTQGRHKRCSVIYLSQSYYRTPKDVRLNCTHFCIFAIPSSRERLSILRDLGVSKEQYNAATARPYDFLYIDKVRNQVAKNFNEPV